MPFTPHERLAIRERDNNECQGCGIWAHCNRDEPERNHKRLEVHHIMPQGYSKKFGINPDTSTNAITLCKEMHTGHVDSIHPDTYQAKMTYRSNPKSYFDTTQARREQLSRREIYWNDQYDRPLKARAVINHQRSVLEGGELSETLQEIERVKPSRLK